jgi:hypothetical protein
MLTNSGRFIAHLCIQIACIHTQVWVHCILRSLKIFMAIEFRFIKESIFCKGEGLSADQNGFCLRSNNGFGLQGIVAFALKVWESLEKSHSCRHLMSIFWASSFNERTWEKLNGLLWSIFEIGWKSKLTLNHNNAILDSPLNVKAVGTMSSVNMAENRRDCLLKTFPCWMAPPQYHAGRSNEYTSYGQLRLVQILLSNLSVL